MSTFDQNPPFPYWLFVVLFFIIGGSLWAWVSHVERQRQQAVNHCLETEVSAQPELQNNPQQIQQITNTCDLRCIRGELSGCQ